MHGEFCFTHSCCGASEERPRDGPLSHAQDHRSLPFNRSTDESETAAIQAASSAGRRLHAAFKSLAGCMHTIDRNAEGITADQLGCITSSAQHLTSLGVSLLASAEAKAAGPVREMADDGEAAKRKACKEETDCQGDVQGMHSSSTCRAKFGHTCVATLEPGPGDRFLVSEC